MTKEELSKRLSRLPLVDGERQGSDGGCTASIGSNHYPFTLTPRHTSTPGSRLVR